MNTIQIGFRSARLDEGPDLTSLALRAKSHWGYDHAFLESARDDLTITEDVLRSSRVYVIENAGALIGFYGILGEPPTGRLEWMFLEPAWIGRGLGRQLWSDAIERARHEGFGELLIESDRFAEPFYLAMGAERIGATPSPVDGGRLPLLRIELRTP